MADEIVVVDSGSSDRTLEICRSFGATCHHHDWQGFGQQKRFAEDRATHDWILNIDADEWLTPDLQREIKAWAAAQPEDGIVGYRIDIKTVYPDRTGHGHWPTSTGTFVSTTGDSAGFRLPRRSTKFTCHRGRCAR